MSEGTSTSGTFRSAASMALPSGRRIRWFPEGRSPARLSLQVEPPPLPQPRRAMVVFSATPETPRRVRPPCCPRSWTARRMVLCLCLMRNTMLCRTRHGRQPGKSCCENPKTLNRFCGTHTSLPEGMSRRIPLPRSKPASSGCRGCGSCRADLRRRGVRSSTRRTGAWAGRLRTALCGCSKSAACLRRTTGLLRELSPPTRSRLEPPLRCLRGTGRRLRGPTLSWTWSGSTPSWCRASPCLHGRERRTAGPDGLACHRLRPPVA